jgi:hypothetical protein
MAPLGRRSYHNTHPRMAPRREARVDPQGKAVLITGCDSGFGRMLAVRLAKTQGLKVYVGCLTDKGLEGIKSEVGCPLSAIIMRVLDLCIIASRNTVEHFINRLCHCLSSTVPVAGPFEDGCDERGGHPGGV